MDKEERLERILGLLNNVAMEAWELPHAERKKYLQRQKQEFYNDAVAAGMSKKAATELANYRCQR